MKRYSTLSYLVVVLLCLGFRGKAQDAPLKFGKISPEELAMTRYGNDSSAAAVILFDYANVGYQYNANVGLQVVLTHHRRLKIFKKAGYDWATFSILTHLSKQGKEYVLDIKGATYRMVNGKMQIDKLQKDAIFEEKKTDQLTVTKITLPNVQEGVIIEYSYKVVSDFDTNIPSWEFQKSIPVAWSELRLDIPTFYQFRFLTQGYEPFYIKNESPNSINFIGMEGNINSTAHRMVVKAAPAIKEEPFMTTIDDYVTKIEFEIAAYHPQNAPSKSFSITWNDMSQALLGYDSFGKLLKSDGMLRDVANTIKATHKDTVGRINAAYSYIQSHVVWNGVSSLYGSDTRKKVFESKMGNSADINLTLVALLRELNLNANPVILSTREHGRILFSHVLEKKFNYVIAHIKLGQVAMLLDATEPLSYAGQIPIRCLNGQGRLIVNGENDKWVPLVSADKKEVLQSGVFRLLKNGDLEGELSITYKGYTAHEKRILLAKGGEAKYQETLMKEYPNWQIKSIKFTDVATLSEPLNAVISLRMKEVATVGQDKIYFNPMFDLRHEKNPFQSSSRKFPIDFATPLTELYTIQIILPDGYIIEELPKSFRLVLPEDAGSFNYLVNSQDSNVILLMNKQFIKKAVFFAEEYQHIKSYYEYISQKGAQQVILKKK
jgi:hypothetical protein